MHFTGAVMQENLRFASSGDDIKIWDASSMTLVDKFNPHTSPHGISSICWSSNNNFLVTASSSGDKIVVSSCKCKPVPLLELAEGQKQTCVNLNSTSMYLVSGGLNNTVNIWDLKSKRVHRSLKDHKDQVTCVTYNWNDCYIASGSLSGEIILHSVTTNLSSTPFGHGSNQSVRHLKYSLFKKSLLGSVSDNGIVTLWDVNSQSPYHNFDSVHKAPASGICFSPVNELLFVTIGLDKRIILYDTSSKKLVKTLVADTPLTAVDFMPDGATLAIGSSRGKIYQYDLRMLKSPVKTISAHKTSVQCIAFQYSTVLTKSSLNKGCSNKPTTVNKRSVNVNAASGGVQNSGIVREAPATSIATVLPQPMTSAMGKGTVAVQEKAGLPRSINTDTLSKETDSGKNQDFSSFDDTGKSSLGDMFSPIRDDAVVNKGSDESIGKGDGFDFLPQLNSVFPPRKNPVTSSTSVLHSSPLNVFMGSPGKEENENRDLTAESKKIYMGKQESKDSFKQLAKLVTSGAESGNLNTSPSSNQTRNSEKFEKPENEIEAQLICEPPINGSSTPNPKIASSVTAGVASSLSEKIADSIGNNRQNAPLTSIQIRFIQNMIQETLDDFREACHRDIVNLQVEMIKQFHMQLNEMHSLLERYSVNEGLVAEIERLREENKRLRAHF
ncbi:NEDD1 gamma-tubulin ring complex targeting factor [Homo sapiens]|nr:protein NEDD1 isoform a [Homo sapiens]XP_005268701.1 protein NEDD1 isoform X1 [Homo sapiens]XP_054227056.1 protein NEDD1 isoform X1 [Homo sapiens]EAW97580.1 neural precursor cell expressed, developmentally down-regulated 1, isoform CRA_c [Homo sapiens]KAI2567449.1 NEDD1 gamma-tubulin ring complex targeting factor [Homo sapiens]KAI4067706.1 NEDD1 gamma-tubulin ring complex targeting factor [Homo sapiens]|eukprot:NP_001128647.1 protein NEDD1 isoform a [Homo sapiens]